VPKDLTALFYPQSIAVLGASRSPQKIGAVVLKNIIDSHFNGSIYPINPQAQSLNGLKCYPDLSFLPHTPDLAIICLPASSIVEILNQIGRKGVKNVVVFSAGFKESGEEGEALENQLVEIAQKYQLNILGPNCLGFANNLCPINATFGEIVSQIGNLRFISQSGAIAAGLFDWFKVSGIGFSQFVTLGNKAILNENDLLEYFADHPISISQEGLSEVSPIGMYLESISDGPNFLRLTGQMSKKDPIFIIKPGKTKEAAKAMQSHTGAIAGQDEVLEAVLNQAGVIRCQTLEDFFDLSRAFAWENAPQGPQVAIISNAGGPAVISADAVIEEGLELVQFDSPTKEHLAQILPRASTILNPVDVLGDALAQRFAQAAEIILQGNQSQALVVILTPQLMTQIGQTAQNLGTLSQKYHKPIFCSFIGGSRIAEGEQKLNEYKIPSFRFPERAIAAVGAMWRWKKQQTEQKEGSLTTTEVPSKISAIEKIIQNALENNQKTLDNLQSNDLISKLGIPTPPTLEAADLNQAKDFAQSSGWPVVLKLSSPGLLHKKEIGGIITNVYNCHQLETGWEALQRKITQLDSAIQDHIKIQIQKEIAQGIETIVGIKHDPTFGPVLLFGAGGSLAELIADKNMHLLPIDLTQAQILVKQSKIYPLLQGKQGEPPYLLDKLYQTIVQMAKLSEVTTEISEMEINPLIITLNNVWAVDNKVILKKGEEKTVPKPQFRLATTLEHTHLVSNFHYFTFTTNQPLIFRPGQYISVKVAGDRINCYSIAGQDKPSEFNLLVNVTPAGPGSKFFENLKVGEKITFLGPFGTFAFSPDDGSSHLLFLATGSGLAPLIYMINKILHEDGEQKQITLYLGFNTHQDIFWLDKFQKLQAQHPNFNYHIIVWKPDTNWQGETGFITQAIEKNLPDTTNCSAYLCGNKGMIVDAIKVIIERGCPKDRIYTEKF